MAGKSLPPYQIINAQSMTGTNVITSSITDIRNIDNVALELVWTGTPTGTFSVQCSIDYNPQLQAGTWTALTLSPSPAASGSASSALIDLNQLGSPYIRVQYTNASSTGTLNGWIAGKAV